MLRSVERMAGAVRSESTQMMRHTTPFVCASCRRASLQSRGTTPWVSRRGLSSSPRPRVETSTASAQQQHHRSTVPQTHYDLFPQTFPQGPPPSSAFTPDLKTLRKEFLQLQAKAHPDFAPQDQKRQAEGMSSRINEAYKTLQDPLKRAQYLLSLRGIDVEDDSAKLSENALLMEVMEAREAVEEVENEAELVALRAENNERIADSVRTLEEAFSQNDMDKAAHEAVRLRYWMNIEESIHGWEQGKGGGILHH